MNPTRWRRGRRASETQPNLTTPSKRRLRTPHARTHRAISRQARACMKPGRNSRRLNLMQKFNLILPVPVLAESPTRIALERTIEGGEARESTKNCDHTGEGSSMVDSRGGEKLTGGGKRLT